MTEEERRIISDYVQRVAGANQPAPAAGPWGGMGGGSVPATQAARPLPPVDREADALIADLFARHPEARYRLTQTAFVQEAALVAAQNRIRQLEWQVENAQAQAPQRGGLFGGMFGGGQRQQHRMSPPPQPQYPPGHNPQMFQGRQGGGFLGSALTTAAGVAGGLVLGNMLMGALSGGGAEAASAAAGAAGDFAQDAVPSSSAWTDPGTAAADQGWGSGAADATPVADQSGWGGQDAGGDAAGYDDGGGYDEDV